MSDNPQDPEEFSIERFEAQERERERRRRRTGEAAQPAPYHDPGAPPAQSPYVAPTPSEYGWNPDSTLTPSAYHHNYNYNYDENLRMSTPQIPATPRPASAGSEEDIYGVSPPRARYTRTLQPVQPGSSAAAGSSHAYSMNTPQVPATPRPASAGSEEDIYGVSPPRQSYTRTLQPVQYGYGGPSGSASSVPSGRSSNVGMVGRPLRPRESAGPSQGGLRFLAKGGMWSRDDIIIPGRYGADTYKAVAKQTENGDPIFSQLKYQKQTYYRLNKDGVLEEYKSRRHYKKDEDRLPSRVLTGYGIPSGSSNVGMMGPPSRPSAVAPPSQSYGDDDGHHAPVVSVSTAMQSMALGPRDESYTYTPTLPRVPYGYGGPSGDSRDTYSYPVPSSSQVGVTAPPPRPTESAGSSQAVWSGGDIVTSSAKGRPLTYKAEPLQTEDGDPIFSRTTGQNREEKTYYRLKDGILEKHGSHRGRNFSGHRMRQPSDPLPLRQPRADWHGNNIIGPEGGYYRRMARETTEGGYPVFSLDSRDPSNQQSKRSRRVSAQDKKHYTNYFSLQDGYLRVCNIRDTYEIAPQQNTPDVPAESHSSAQLGSPGMGGQPAGVTYSSFGDISFSGGPGYNYSSGSQSMAHPQQRIEHAAVATYTQAQQPQQRSRPDSTHEESVTSTAPSDDRQQRRRHRADDGDSHGSSHGKRGRHHKR
jgi:hypothetical protein